MTIPDLKPLFKQIEEKVDESYIAMVLDTSPRIGLKGVSAEVSFWDGLRLGRLQQFISDVKELSKKWDNLEDFLGKPPPTPSNCLHLGSLVGQGSNQTEQMLWLIETVGAAKIYDICKSHKIVAPWTGSTKLFVDVEPTADSSSPVRGEDGKTYYVYNYSYLSLEQKQKRLDEVAKWLP